MLGAWGTRVPHAYLFVGSFQAELAPYFAPGHSPGSSLTTDQRGGLFKRKFGIAVDIGAYERQ